MTQVVSFGYNRRQAEGPDVKARRSLGAMFLAALLCCSACSTLRQETVPAAPAALRTGSPANQVADGTGPFLYVVGAKLSKYALGSPKPLRTAKLSFIAFAVAVDKLGDVYTLGNEGSCEGEIQVFSARDLTLLRTIQTVCLSSIAIDAHGYVYVASCCGGLFVYAPGASRQVYHIKRFSAGALAFDRSGLLYSAGVNQVAIYSVSEPGHLKLVRTIHRGVKSPTVLAFGPSDELFVANWPGCNPPCGPPSVSVFARDGSKPVRRIFKGLAMPGSLAVDSTGTLYVGDSTVYGDYPWHSWVSVYGPDGVQLLRKLAKHKGAREPSVRVDASNDLYVANDSNVLGIIYLAHR
jgi:hypothetical protein